MQLMADYFPQFWGTFIKLCHCPNVVGSSGFLWGPCMAHSPTDPWPITHPCCLVIELITDKGCWEKKKTWEGAMEGWALMMSKGYWSHQELILFFPFIASWEPSAMNYCQAVSPCCTHGPLAKLWALDCASSVRQGASPCHCASSQNEQTVLS